MSRTDALAYLDEAMQALCLEGYTSETGEPGTWERAPEMRFTLADDLERIDGALGHRVFAPMADRIKQAVVAIEAARRSLAAGGSHD